MRACAAVCKTGAINPGIGDREKHICSNRTIACDCKPVYARLTRPALPHSFHPPTQAGKGYSEFFYSWIPFVAPFAGGAIAGGFYLAVQKMNQTAVP